MDLSDLSKYTFAYVFTDNEKAWHDIIPNCYVFSMNFDTVFDHIFQFRQRLWNVNRELGIDNNPAVVLYDTKSWHPSVDTDQLTSAGIHVQQCSPAQIKHLDCFKKMFNVFYESSEDCS